MRKVWVHCGILVTIFGWQPDGCRFDLSILKVVYSNLEYQPMSSMQNKTHGMMDSLVRISYFHTSLISRQQCNILANIKVFYAASYLDWSSSYAFILPREYKIQIFQKKKRFRYFKMISNLGSFVLHQSMVRPLLGQRSFHIFQLELHNNNLEEVTNLGHYILKHH